MRYLIDTHIFISLINNEEDLIFDISEQLKIKKIKFSSALLVFGKL